MNLRFLTKQAQKVERNVPSNNDICVVRCMPRAFWEKLGWERTGDTYQGYYRTPFGSFQGYIVQQGKVFCVYIFNPPAEAKKHPKWSCFVHTGNGWFWVNQKRFAKDVDGAIMAVQRIIEDSFKIASYATRKGVNYA